MHIGIGTEQSQQASGDQKPKWSYNLFTLSCALSLSYSKELDKKRPNVLLLVRGQSEVAADSEDRKGVGEKDGNEARDSLTETAPPPPQS